jgi:hypothetical protein
MSVLLTNSEKNLEKREKLVANLFLKSYTNPILSSTNLHIIKSKGGLGRSFACEPVCLSVCLFDSAHAVIGRLSEGGGTTDCHHCTTATGSLN